jgi:hypothetical protein
VRTDVVPVEPPDVSMYLEYHDKHGGLVERIG